MDKSSWPPDYTKVFLKRQERYLKISTDPILQAGAKAYYKDRPVEFIEDWGITYDPRNAGEKDKPPLMPFSLFARQVDLILFFEDCLNQRESGLVEKTRDMGATWVATAYSVYLWLFRDGSSIGWGSRKEQLVEKIGDPDSIFEKIRMQIRYLPKVLLPEGFLFQKHCSYMKIINPENGSTITGESGDNIGRGGRKSIFFKDESSHYERPELIEAALGDNTDVQIDISSVNGNANIFARRRQAGEEWEKGKTIESGVVRVFVMDWRDHPLKTQAWYDRRRKKADREGLLHIFAQEVDRDYSSSVEGVLVKSEWVKAAIDFHEKFEVNNRGLIYSGLDIADEGGDRNAQAIRHGIVLNYLDEWGTGDAGQSTVKAVVKSRGSGVDELHYDCIGVGATAKSEVNRLSRDGDFDFGKLKVLPWSASSGVVNPDENTAKGDKESPKNKDTFKNFKAQASWALRLRFEKTYKYVHQGEQYPTSELISIDSRIKHFDKLVQQLSQPTYSHDSVGRIIVDKNPNGVKSPDLFDAVNMAYFPAPPKTKTGGTWGTRKK